MWISAKAMFLTEESEVIGKDITEFDDISFRVSEVSVFNRAEDDNVRIGLKNGYGYVINMTYESLCEALNEGINAGIKCK